MLDPVAFPLGALAVVLLLVASGFFSATELAVFSLPAGWTAGTDRRGRTLDRLRADPHRLLVTLLVGNNLANVALASVITLAVSRALPAGEAVVVSTLLASTVVLVFGEILPKAYGLGHAEAWSLFAARPLRVVQFVLAPVVVAFDRLTGPVGRWIGGDRRIEGPYVE